MINIDKWILKPETIAKSKKYYAHFDSRTDIKKVAKYITDPEWVSHHGFYPFIHYKKDCSKYSINGKIDKKRDICYAAHIDRCILQFYCHKMNVDYNQKIRAYHIEDVPVAYRSDLGLSNIHLAQQAFNFIKKNPKGYVMIGDFTGFFDNLDHTYLKEQWCKLLDVNQLPSDYYAIFKNITRYSVWELDDLIELNGLKKNSSGRKKLNAQRTVLTTKQFKKYRSHIHKNPNHYGIPQGSPISALLANVYMIDVDQKIKAIVSQHKGLYMRYSDDFIIVLPVEETAAHVIIEYINKIIHNTPGLELEPRKTQIYRTNLPIINNVGDSFLDEADKSKNTINFLGFTFDGVKILLRAKTVSKYYYRMYRKARVIAGNPNHKGKDHLYERYSERGAGTGHKKQGNFFTYVHRAENIFGESEGINKPVKNHMAKIRKAIKRKQS